MYRIVIMICRLISNLAFLNCLNFNDHYYTINPGHLARILKNNQQVTCLCFEQIRPLETNDCIVMKNISLDLCLSVAENRKALELSGTGTDEIEEAEEVRTAREELKVLHEEKHKTEKLRATVKKELEAARAKTRKLEEVSSRYKLYTLFRVFTA